MVSICLICICVQQNFYNCVEIAEVGVCVCLSECLCGLHVCKSTCVSEVCGCVCMFERVFVWSACG